MTLPTIFDWINHLAPLRGWPTLYLILALSFIIVIVADWRINLLALTGTYLVGGMLFVEVLEPRLAYVKVMAGLFVSLVLYVTARQVPNPPTLRNAASQPDWNRHMRLGTRTLSTSWPVRLILTSITGGMILLMGAQSAWQLPGLSLEPAYLTTAVYGLMALGLLTLGLTAEPLRAGMGLLLLLTGFELYYTTLGQSLESLTALASVNLVVALVIAYLAQAGHMVTIRS